MLDAQLAQPPLGVLVARRDQPDDGHARDRQPAEGVAVQPPQVGREQRGLRLAGGGGREQVGEVDAAAHDADAEVAAGQRGDELGLPDRVADGGQDGDGH